MREISREEKEMRGTYEASREGIEPVELAKYEINPPANSDWPPNIQKIWRDRCQDLKTAGYLVKAFMPHLERYCFAILQAEKAEEMLLSDGFIVEEIGTKGQVYTVPSKWLSVLDQANKVIDRIGAKFGFTPLDVQKIPVVRKEVKEESLLK
jgi:phage terminase small subunit